MTHYYQNEDQEMEVLMVSKPIFSKHYDMNSIKCINTVSTITKLQVAVALLN